MPPPSALPPIPLFSPDAAGGGGLELLAAAAATASAQTTSKNLGTSQPRTSLTQQGLNSRGPFNPAASLSTRVVKRILELEFVDMAEVTVDDKIPTGWSQAPPRLPITDISQWVERFSLMAAVLVTRFPEKAPELWAYQATIVRAQRNYEGNRWVSYDRQYRREALARKDLNWSITDSRLYNEAFTGRARAIPRCAYCLQDDHGSTACPRNPDRAWVEWHSTQTPPWSLRPLPPVQPAHNAPQEICRRFNEGRCKTARCRFAHMCRECSSPHPAITCPRLQGFRDRSPQNPTRQAPNRGLPPLGPRPYPPNPNY